jgi:hypothetical protein
MRCFAVFGDKRNMTRKLEGEEERQTEGVQIRKVCAEK